MLQTKDRKKKYAFELFFILGIPLVILFCGIVLLKIREPEFLPKIQKSMVKEVSSTDLTPASIAKSPLEFQDKIVTIYGKLEYVGKDCGDEKTIQLTEPESSVFEEKSKIKIFGPSKTLLCQKVAGTQCDYDCDEFKVNEEYEVTGKIILERPIGMTLARGYLDYYIEPQNVQKIFKQTENNQNNIIQNIIDKFSAPLSPKEL